MEIEQYLGVGVCALDMEATLEAAKEIIKSGDPSFIVAINPEKIMKARLDPELTELLNSAALKIPDGVGIVLASRLNGGRIKSRVTGIDLMDKICCLANDKGYRVYMLGGKPGIAQQAAQVLMERYRNIQIVGTQDGYFSKDEEAVQKIREAKPEILFVAMGSPRQEKWIVKNKAQLGVPLLMGVGGSYDVLCGNIKRAPRWMCKLGLEWLYRLVKEPWRYKRMLVLPIFLWKVILERVKK